MGHRHAQFESIAGFGCGFGITSTEHRIDEPVELDCRAGEGT
jgi:hypothetical protein